MARLDEQRVVLTFDLFQTITEHVEEIVVRIQHAAREIETDHRLRLADSIDLALEVSVAAHLLGDVGGVFHHLERAAALVENRVVARLDPDLAAIFANPLIDARVVVAALQLLPEGAIFGRPAIGRIDEDRMMLAADILQPVAERIQEVGVRIDDTAIEAKLDHRLRTVHRGQLALLGPQLGDIHPFEDIAAVGAGRIVAGAYVERELQVTHRDVSTERQLRLIGEHAALMPRVAMECVDVHADNPVGIKRRPQLAKVFLMPAQQFLRAAIDSGHNEITVHRHHRDRHGIERFTRPRTHSFQLRRLGHIAGECHDPRRHSLVRRNRRELQLQNDETPISGIVAQAESGGLTTPHSGGKVARSRAVTLRLSEQSGVGLANDLLRGKAEQSGKWLDGADHDPVRRQFHNRLVPLERGENGLLLAHGDAPVAFGATIGESGNEGLGSTSEKHDRGLRGWVRRWVETRPGWRRRRLGNRAVGRARRARPCRGRAAQVRRVGSPARRSSPRARAGYRPAKLR